MSSLVFYTAICMWGTLKYMPQNMWLRQMGFVLTEGGHVLFHQISKLIAEITLNSSLEMLMNSLCPCQIPTGETLEQFVCSALSSVPGDEANKENDEEGCNSAWHEVKMYLVHTVSKLRLYAQVYFNKLID